MEALDKQPPTTLEQKRAQVKLVAQRHFAGIKTGNKKKYVVVCGEYGSTYACGVFNRSEEAQKYVNRLDTALKPEIVEVVAKKYPIYIVECHRKLLFTDDFNDITNKIQTTRKIKDFDDCYFTYYIINRSFSTEGGIDQMGALDHVHVTNDNNELYSE